MNREDHRHNSLCHYNFNCRSTGIRRSIFLLIVLLSICDFISARASAQQVHPLPGIDPTDTVAILPSDLPDSSDRTSSTRTLTDQMRPETTDLLVDSSESMEAPEDSVRTPETGMAPYPREPVGKGSTKITAGARYDHGWLHRIFFGDLWRDLWTTEITVPYLDLEKTGGGLTPTEVGGGNQTSSLRFEGKDGYEYKFRSVDKDPTGLLPEGLRGSFARDVVQDFIAAQNPAGALAAVPLMDAVGIINVKPYLFVMPDDPRLGEFRKNFAGVLGTLEIHPNEGPDDTPGYMGYRKIIGSDELYEKLREDNDDQVDYVEYLKVRLLDMIVSDWDRHRDQYRWAEVEDGDQSRWLPIPRDRDMVFARYDGLVPNFAETKFPEITGLEENFPDIENLTWAGKTLDRRFLAPISRRQWDSTTQVVMVSLSDQVIDNAISKMPPEYIALEGEWLRKVLRNRRDKLREASKELFELVQEETQVWGTDNDEYVEVSRLDDEHVRVEFYKRDKDNGEKKGKAYFDHTFDRRWTDEIRIIMLGGDDKVVINGNVNSSITVKVDGGKGTDEYVDNSKVNGFFWFTPIPDAETSTYFYDSDDDSKFAPGAGTRLDRREHKAWREDSVAWFPYYRDYGNQFMWAPWLGYSSDDGIFTGLKAHIMGFGFRQEPYAWDQSFGAGFAFGTKAFRAEYDGDFRTFIPNARVLIDADASQLEVLNFFGFGNETGYNEALDLQDYYDIGQLQLSLRTDVQIPQISDFRFYIGAQGSYTRTELGESPILDSLQPYGVEPTGLLAARTGFILDTRDKFRAASKGFYVTLSGEYFPTILDNRESFIKGGIDARTYMSANVLRPITLALRGKAEAIVGDQYPYFESAFLGGSQSLRGFDSDRFAGDISLLGSAELRLSLFDFRILAPGTFGVVGFADMGRVYLDGETSDTWHHAFGGGLALSLIDLNNVLTATVAQSDEGQMAYYLRFGYSF